MPHGNCLAIHFLYYKSIYILGMPCIWEIIERHQKFVEEEKVKVKDQEVRDEELS